MNKRPLFWKVAVLFSLVGMIPLPGLASGADMPVDIGETLTYYVTNNTRGIWTAETIEVTLSGSDSVYDAQAEIWFTRINFAYRAVNFFAPTEVLEAKLIEGLRFNQSLEIVQVPVAVIPQCFVVPSPANYTTLAASITTQLPDLINFTVFSNVLQFTYKEKDELHSMEFAYNQMGVLAQYRFHNATLDLSYTITTTRGDFPVIPMITFSALVFSIAGIAVYYQSKGNPEHQKKPDPAMQSPST